MVELEILYDEEKEHREAFTLHLKNDRKMVADVKVSYPYSCWGLYFIPCECAFGYTGEKRP